ncbi:MAG: metallophosphoesterase family protein [Clostridia bacterium]|nr:metallophosphoesterase family protein [Clostridia bacterium]
MKYAIISDVHGNAHALKLALEDARRKGAEGFLFAGDYCISMPWANEAITLIRSVPNAHIIRGNDENHLDVPSGDDGQFEVARWCARALTPENRAWLDALPETLNFTLEGVPVHMAHSSEAFVGKALHARFRTSRLPSHYPDGPVPRDVLTADFRAFASTGDLAAAISALEPGVYIFGHNHIQTWGDFDGRVLINPGSVGLPLDCGAQGAAYSLLTIEDGSVTVEERRVPYDLECLIGKIRESAQYAAARIWTETIFSELRTCREKVAQFLWSCEEYANRIGDARRPFAKDTWQAAYDEWVRTARDRFPALFV